MGGGPLGGSAETGPCAPAPLTAALSAMQSGLETTPCPCSRPQAQYFCSGELSPPDYHHYGLAAPLYTHFTSPIRWAPRLVRYLCALCIYAFTPLRGCISALHQPHRWAAPQYLLVLCTHASVDPRGCISTFHRLYHAGVEGRDWLHVAGGRRGDARGGRGLGPQQGRCTGALVHSANPLTLRPQSA